MEREIAHVTLTTGHQRNSYVDDIDPQLYFKLRVLFQDAAKSHGMDFIDNTHVQLTKIDEDSYICTLYIKTEQGLCPILTTAGSKKMDMALWTALHENCFSPVLTDPHKPPTPPFIADRIDVPHPDAIGVLSWTGDFAKCLGWMMLFPDEIAARTIIQKQEKDK